jgi:hypothetical protein
VAEVGWTQDKTAEDLGISRQAIGKALVTLWPMVGHYKRQLEGSKSAGNPNLLRCNKLDGWTQKQTASPTLD